MTEAEIRDVVMAELCKAIPVINEGLQRAMWDFCRAMSRQMEEHHQEAMRFLRDQHGDGDWWKGN
jgi:hypothetical protein